MTGISEILPLRKVQFTQQTYNDLLEMQCRDHNETYGSLNETDNINCGQCRNKGEIWFVKDGYISAARGPRCTNIRRSIKLMKLSGLADNTFDSYVVCSDWQKKMFDTVYEYAESSESEWLYLGGQSGCGKTHLCTAALGKLIYDRQCSVVLFKWADDSKLLKGYVNDSVMYSEKIAEYKNAQILYIDDFFKVKKGEEIKPADINLAFELIDHRCRHKLKTVISSEFSLDEIIAADEATGGRIKQMTGRYALNACHDREKNYRLRLL